MTLDAIYHFGAKRLPVVVAQPDETQNRTASVLEWYDRHRAYNIWFKRSKTPAQYWFNNTARNFNKHKNAPNKRLKKLHL